MALFIQAFNKVKTTNQMTLSKYLKHPFFDTTETLRPLLFQLPISPMGGLHSIAGPLPFNLRPSTPQLKTVVLYHNAFKGKLLSLQNATQLETLILHGGNEWADNVQLEPFCNNQKFPRMNRFVVRPCTNNAEESHMLLPYCSCCHCCPDSSTSECHLYHWFPETENAWDTRYTKDRFRTREVMLSETDLLKLSNPNKN